MRGTLSPELLERLYAEVRIGRQVSHPNVCRLYDVVEVDGHTFLAMEYVDGEDLASLLARIGRLPADKALDIARDLCAGLAAVHDKGIVHRDLKPANVMIDGRGRARLTDFGLAVGARRARARPAFAGTPAYMAPEQLAGGAVTAAQRPLRPRASSSTRCSPAGASSRRRPSTSCARSTARPKAPRLASVARAGSTRAVERVIPQCLEEDPAARPSSARAVLARCPAATRWRRRSPRARRPRRRRWPRRPRWATSRRPRPGRPGSRCSAGSSLAAWLYDRDRRLSGRAAAEAPRVLAERARECSTRLGHAKRPPTPRTSFDWDRALLARTSRGTTRSPDRWDQLRARRSLPLHVLLSPEPAPPGRRRTATRMVRARRPAAGRAGHGGGGARPPRPAPDLPGRAAARESRRGAWPEPDWSPLSRRRGSIRSASAGRAAAVGGAGRLRPQGRLGRPYPGEPADPGPHRGRRVPRPAGLVRGPAAVGRGRRDGRAPARSRTPVGEASVVVLALAMPIGGVLLARRNLRLGRGDRRGAFRVALFVFLTYAIARPLPRRPRRALRRRAVDPDQGARLSRRSGRAQVWLLYLALEPYARRRWPHMLISWKRLLAGQAARSPGRPRRAVRRRWREFWCSSPSGRVLAAARVLGQPPISPGRFLDGADAQRVAAGRLPAVREPVQRGALRDGLPVHPGAAAHAGAEDLAGGAAVVRAAGRRCRAGDPAIEWVAGGLRAAPCWSSSPFRPARPVATALFFMFTSFETILPSTCPPGMRPAACPSCSC